MTKWTIPGFGAFAVGALAVAAALIVFAAAASAAGTVSLDSPSVGADGTATVTLTAAAPNGSGIGNWEFDINYNPGDYVGDPTCQDIAAGGLCAVKPGGADGMVRFAGATSSPHGLTGSIEIGTIAFTSDLAPGACSALTITIIAFQDKNGHDFASPTITNGEVCAPVPTATPTPTPTAGTSRIWGDVDCGGDIGPRDAQAILKNVLGQNALSQTQPCPAVGSQVTVDGVSRIWGDVDCSGDIAPRDAQAILKNVLVQNALSQTQPCPAVGSTVQVVG
jgi:hypothetical protein